MSVPNFLPDGRGNVLEERDHQGLYPVGPCSSEALSFSLREACILQGLYKNLLETSSHLDKKKQK